MRMPFRLSVAALFAVLFMVPALVSIAVAQPAKLLITQTQVLGGGSTSAYEYVVIKNPGTTAVDLSRYYLTDATFANGNQYYYNVTDPALPIGGGDFNDFIGRFPNGAMIQPGQELSIAINGSNGFLAEYGVNPHFELYEDGAAADNIPDLVPARTGSIVSNTASLPSLSNSGEVIILFYWDGESPKVTDIDYLVWGDKVEAVDKTGVTIRGQAYLPDTAINSQNSASPAAPTGAFVRASDSEGTQKTTGSNGVGGRDETSENLATTFTQVASPSPPGQGAVDTTPPVLVSASGAGGATSVTVTFSEPVTTGANTAANYAVFPTATPAGTLPVSAASVSGSVVTLTLGSALAPATGYTVRVNNVQDAAGNTIAANSTVTFTSTAPASFQVTGAFQFGKNYVAVAFSQAVNVSQATNIANYSFSPALTIAEATMQENGRTVILRTASNLPSNTAFAATVTGVTSSTGSALLSTGPFNFTTVSGTVLNIAEIQANPQSFVGQSVTVIGQVYIPVSSRGGTPSGYIQDGSARGINLFGGSAQAAVDNRGNVVSVTGNVLLFFTTVEIEQYTATVLAQNQPPLGAKVLTVAQANSSQWEGTFIQTSGPIAQIITSGVGGAVNYEVGEGSSRVTIRVDNDLGINSGDFQVGNQVTGRGAGGAFQATFQINVGIKEDFFKGGGPADTTPPTLISATGEGGTSTVRVNFSEAVAAGANVPGNFTVTPSGGSPIAVNSAVPNGATVTLTLAQALAGGTSYSVRVSNVADAAGNVIAANSQVNFTASSAGAFTVGKIFQFGKNRIGVAYTARVNAAGATNPANYSFSPGLNITSIEMQANGQTAILTTGADVPTSTSYTVGISNVTSSTGGALEGSSFPLTTAATPVINISELQANAADLNSQTVSVIGQVYMPVGSRGGTPSGYIQDGSGRGVNLFGGSTQAAVNTVGNVVQVTGTVELFFTTVEITGYTVNLLAERQPALAPRVVTVPEANSPLFEGTFIEVTGPISQKVTEGVGGAVNYVVSGGGAFVTLRVDNDLGINANNFTVGETVTGRGAGGQFQSTFQINVGLPTDFRKAGDCAGDSVPPFPSSAAGPGGDRLVTVTFSEPVERASAEVSANYQVAVTGDPGRTLSVERATADGASVTLRLGGNLEFGTSYTVTVSNVRDLCENTVAPNSTVTFVSGAGKPTTARLTVPAKTFIRNLETITVKIEGGDGSTALCRIFDTQGRLVKVLADGVLPLSNPERTWDGRDESLEFVRAGMYICHLRTTDLDGNVTTDEVPLVVAVRLQ